MGKHGLNIVAPPGVRILNNYNALLAGGRKTCLQRKFADNWHPSICKKTVSRRYRAITGGAVQAGQLVSQRRCNRIDKSTKIAETVLS